MTLAAEHLHRARAHEGQARRLNRHIRRELECGEVVSARLYQEADRHSAAARRHREAAKLSVADATIT
jgi:hypothetical protein